LLPDLWSSNCLTLLGDDILSPGFLLENVEEISHDNLKKLHKYLGRHGLNISKSIDLNVAPSKIFMEKLDISPKYLRNLNDYNIAENFKVDEGRQIKFERKTSKVFDCLVDKQVDVKPETLSVSKWSKFHENYYSMSDTSGAFRLHKGYFTDFADHQKATMDLKKFMFMEKLNKERKEKSNNPVSHQQQQNVEINKQRYGSNNRQKENTKKKTMEVIDKNRLYKIKSYLIKNGGLN